MDSTPTWRMLVAPTKATLRRTPDLREGAPIAPDSTIGSVQSSRDTTGANAAHSGTIVAWLAEDGDLVSPGQPLIRLHLEGTTA